MGCSLLFKLFGSGVSGCGFSECFPSWLLDWWLGRGALSGEACLLSGCSQLDWWGGLYLHSAAFEGAMGALKMWVEVS